LTLTLFLGFTVLLDLRLLGVSMRRRKASDVVVTEPMAYGSFL